MLNADILKFRSDVLHKLRAFFTSRDFIELDTPAMSPELPPDTGCEVFKTAYDDPWTGEQKTVFLLPSHRYFLSKAVTALKRPVFQLSKNYRNGEVADSLTSPEFTLLEAYIPGISPDEAANLTETLITTLLLSDSSFPSHPPYRRITLDEACITHAGFDLSHCRSQKKLIELLKEQGFTESPSNRFRDWQEEELFELLLTQRLVPALPENECLFITGWPSFRKEQWVLYAAGTETAVSYGIPEGDEKTGSSVIELHADRLIMMLADKKSIESIIPFPFRLKKGYY